MTSPFMGGGGLMQKWDVIGLGEVGGYRVFWTSSLYFFIKENWICAVTRRHAEPNIYVLS